MLKKATSSLGVVAHKNQLVDSFDNNFRVASNLILDVLNKALETRTNLIFQELTASTRVSPT